MPPEPSPWDRKDSFREKRYEKPDTRERRDFAVQEAGSFGKLQPAVSEISSNRSVQVSWPYVRYRQGRQSLFFEDAAYGFAPGQSTDFLVQERMYEDENPNFRLEGRFHKTSREHMGPNQGPRYHQRGQRLQNWDNGDANLLCTGRHDVLSGKSVDQMSLHLSHPHSDSESSWDQVQSREKGGKTGVEHSAIGYKSVAYKRTSDIDFGRFTEKDFETRLDRYGSASSNDSLIGVSQNQSRDHLTSSIDWKPLKWVRSGNSFFGQAGSFKESRAELQTSLDLLGKTSPQHSPSRLTSDGVCFVPDEESHPRKKQRLGWGQGLAKYEKQKVGGAEDDNKINLIECSISASPKVEEVGHARGGNSEARSPKAAASSGCGSPATPYSVAYFSSPDEHVSSSGARFNEVGLYEKDSVKIPNAVSNGDHFPHGNPLPCANLRATGSCSIVAESSMESEHVDVNPFTHVNSLAVDNLQTEDASLGFSDSRRPDAISKILLVKNDILQKLEKTEHDIDMCEKELRSLNFETKVEGCYVLETNCSHANKDCILELCAKAGEKGFEDRGIQVASTLHQQNDGFVVPSSVSQAAEVCVSSPPLENQSSSCQVGKIDSNVADMQAVGPQWLQEVPLEKQFMGCQGVRTEDKQDAGFQSSSALRSDGLKCVSTKADSEALETQLILATEQKSGASVDLTAEVAVQTSCMIESADNVFSILSANKELAKEALGLFVKLLPTALPRTGGAVLSDIQDADMGKHNGMTHERYKKQMEEKIVDRNHFLIFKEQVLAIKFRALRQLWKEDQLLSSTRKYRARAQKRWESNCRFNGGHQKYRSSIRSRFGSSGKLTLLPTKETVQLACKLLADGHIRPCRSILKMPALALDDKESLISRFISRNGLIDDPIAFEKERAMINPWTPGEREIFTEKFATFGKNFSKIASFIEHKTTADCIEFYYKNQKCEDLEKIKKRHRLQKQTRPSTFLASSGNNRPRETNAASLDVLGAASVVAAYSSDQATVIHGTLQKYSGRPTLGMCFDPGRLRNEGFMASNKRIFANILDSERECTAAADVLAGIFGAFSSEALSSCITSAVDPSEGRPEKNCARPYENKSAVVGQTLTSEVMQNVEVQYSSEESCEEVNLDWTDDEKGLFITAVSMFGKNFQNISHYVRSRTEDQCKTFFSKARKRLGLDKLIQRELPMPMERGPGSDDDDSGLIETCTGLCNVDSSSAKMAETPESNGLSPVQQNGRSEVVLDEDGNGYLRNDTDKKSLNKQTELTRGSVEAVQNDVKVIPGEAFVCSEARHSLSGEGLHVGVLAEMQQDENEAKVLDSVLSRSTEHAEGTNCTESSNSAGSFDGNSGKGNEWRSCEPLSHSHASKLSVDIESSDTFQADGNTEKIFINSKSELKKNVQDVGSSRAMLSLKEDKCLPASMEKGKCSVVSLMSDCCKSVGIESLPTIVPHQKSSYCCSSLKSGIVTSNNTLKAASDGGTMTVHVSDDITDKGKCFVGSGHNYLESDHLESDHFGKNSGVMPTTRNGESRGGTSELSVQDSILEENGCISTNKEVAWKMYSDHKVFGSFPVHGQDKTSICTSAVFQFQQQHSNAFSHSPEQNVYYMQPQVVLWKQKQKESSPVPQQDQSMLKQASVSSALIRNQQLDNPMFHNYPRQNGSHHQIQQDAQRSMPLSIMCQGSDSEQSSQQFGGLYQLQARGENHRHMNTDTCQKEMLQQSVSDSERSSRIISGYPVQVCNQEEVCMPVNLDAFQQATLQQVAQGSYSSCMKNLRQCQVTQQNPQQEILRKLHAAASQNLAAQYFQKPNSEQAIKLSNQRDQSLQFSEQYQLHPWQQKHKVHNVSCENHMFLQKTGWNEEHQEHLKHQGTNTKFNPAGKSAYSCQSQVAHLQPPCLDTEVKSSPESEAQTLRSGDVKLFGQILLSHPSRQVRLEASPSTRSMQSGCKIFNGHENEWSFVSASPEKQSSRKSHGLHSECVEVSVKESESRSVQAAIAQVTERLASEARGTKHNLAEFSAAYSGQEYAMEKFGCWEVKGGHNMSVQTVASPQSRDVKYLQVKPLHDSLPDIGLIDQPAMTGYCKEMAKDSTMILGGQSRLTHDGRLSGRREPEGDPFFALDLKQQDFFIELEKRGVVDMADSHESAHIGATHGRHGRLQPSMFGFQPQFRSISRHTGFHRGVLHRGIVSDPVAAMRMQCSAGEQMAVAMEHPQVTSIRGPEPERGDYGR